MSGNRFAEENRFLGSSVNNVHYPQKDARDEIVGSLAAVLRTSLEEQRFEIIGAATETLRARARSFMSRRPSVEGLLQTLMYPFESAIGAIVAGTFLWQMRRLVMGLGLSPEQQEAILQARAHNMAHEAILAVLDTLGHHGYSPDDARRGGRPTDHRLLPDAPSAADRFRTRLREGGVRDPDILMIEDALRQVKLALPEDRELPEPIEVLL